MSHSPVPPQGPDPFGSGGPGQPGEDPGHRPAFAARQAVVIAVILGVTVLFVVLIFAATRPPAHDGPDYDIGCETSTGGYLDDLGSSDDGFDFGRTDDDFGDDPDDC